jgi:hypothetical protein
MGANLLIGPDGRLVRMHYHRYLGDNLHLPNLLPVVGR